METQGRELVLGEVAFTDARVQALVAEVQAYYVEVYGGPDEGPVDADEFTGERGRFLLGTADGEPVAMGGWRWRPDLRERFGWAEAVEVKRMFVAPGARGHGHARTVLAALEDSAAAAGAQWVVLETGTMQPEAIALYGSSGYAPVPPFGHYATSELVRCFGKRVGRADLS